MTGKRYWAWGLAATALILAGIVLWAGFSSTAETQEAPVGGLPPAENSRSLPAGQPLESGQPLEPPLENGQYVVELKNLRFQPARLEIPVGTVVTFVNRDSVLHDVVQTSVNQLGREGAGFSSPRLGPGDVWSYEFTEPGRYPILCLASGHYASGMVGTIIVYSPAGTQ